MMRGIFALLLAVSLLAGILLAGKKKKKDEEPITQVLELPKDLPATVSADSHRLVFQVSPLSAKGLLSQQARDAIHALWRLNKGGSIVKLRAFVAGTGDMRRVQTLVSEEFTEKKLPLPVLTTVQAGGLPMEGAQVLIESVAVDRRETTPNGIAFLSGQAEAVEGYQPKAAPLVERSLAKLKAAAEEAQVASTDLVRVSCFVTSLEDAADSERFAHAAFPQAVITLVQLQRGPTRSLSECEGVARLTHPNATPLSFTKSQANYSEAALVGSSKLIFSGSQLGFQAKESDVALAYQRLGKNLESAGTSFHNVAMVSTYTLSPGVTEQIRKIRFRFLDPERPPASTLLTLESLPSLDASFALDVVAIAP